MHPKFIIPILSLPLIFEFLDKCKFSMIFAMTLMLDSKSQMELLILYKIYLISSEELV